MHKRIIDLLEFSIYDMTRKIFSILFYFNISPKIFHLEVVRFRNLWEMDKT